MSRLRAFRIAEHPGGLSEQQLRTLVRGFAKSEVLRRDVARLVKLRGPGACP